MMRAFGIDSLALNELREIFERHLHDLPDAKIWLFGSRAKGSYKKNSDIDLVISSRSKKIKERLPHLRLDIQDSNVPYLVDLVFWPEIAESFVKEVKKTRLPFWNPKMIEKRSAWRICPIGQHWVRQHLRERHPGPLEDVDGHCRRNPSGKDFIKTDELKMIPRLPQFIEALRPNNSDMKFKNGNKYDSEIAGWVAFWNETLGETSKMHPDWIKILIATESDFKHEAFNDDQAAKVGRARGLGQITEQTWRILKNPKGELKDHFVDISLEDLNDPSINIAAMTRWIFRKRQTARVKLKREPTLKELLLQYKGVLGQNPKNKKVAAILKELYEESKKLNVDPDKEQ